MPVKFVSSHPLISVVVGARPCNYNFPPFPVFRCPQEISKLHSSPFLGVINKISH